MKAKSIKRELGNVSATLTDYGSKAGEKKAYFNYKSHEMLFTYEELKILAKMFEEFTGSEKKSNSGFGFFKS